MVTIEDKQEIAMMILDQGTWRGMEWGDGLVEGQFDNSDVPFTKDNVEEVFTWIQSVPGQEHLTEVMEQNSCYWDSCETIEDSLEEWNDEDYGYFGKATMEEEMEKAND